VGRLGSGPRLVGRTWSGLRVSAIFRFKNVATLRGGYLRGDFLLGGNISEECILVISWNHSHHFTQHVCMPVWLYCVQSQ